MSRIILLYIARPITRPIRRNCASLSKDVGLNQQILDSASYVNIPGKNI